MLSVFTVDIEPEAFDDIQNAVDYYNDKQAGLGLQFFNAIDKNIEFLKSNYYSFAIRYDDIRCLNIKGFPYSIHYRVLKTQKTISIKAVFCNYQDDNKWIERIK